MKRTLFLAALAAMTATSFVACTENKDKDENKDEKKAVLITLGTKTTPYWQQIATGVRTEAEKMNVDLHLVYSDNDEDITTTPEALRGAGQIKNLAGVAGQINKKEFDDALKNLPQGVNLILIEGIGVENGYAAKRYNGIVGVNNSHYAQALIDSVPESKLVVMGYSSGNNVEVINNIVSLKGKDNVRVCLLSDQNNAVDSLQALANDIAKADAVIFASANFVSQQTLALVEGKTVYSSDLNESVAGFIKSGKIKLNISPDTFSFGRLVLLATLDGESYEVPYIFTGKWNVDSADRAKFLK